MSCMGTIYLRSNIQTKLTLVQIIVGCLVSGGKLCNLTISFLSMASAPSKLPCGMETLRDRPLFCGPFPAGTPEDEEEEDMLSSPS